MQHASGLCVWCYNALQQERTPRIVRAVEKREPGADAPALAARAGS